MVYMNLPIELGAALAAGCLGNTPIWLVGNAVDWGRQRDSSAVIDHVGRSGFQFDTLGWLTPGGDDLGSPYRK